MKIEIDIKEIVHRIDVNKLIEDKIISDISDNIDIYNIVDKALEDEEIKNQLNKKIVGIIDNYIDSEDGKNRVIGAFNNAITSPDILADDRITDIMVEFLKRKLDI